MYTRLLSVHSIFRWLVLIALFVSIYHASTGLMRQRVFSKFDNALRHWTATIAHIQLMIGVVLYFQSPLAMSFWKTSDRSIQHFEVTFYGIIHLVLMLVAIVLITLGSALAKRKSVDHAKFRTMLTWFTVALLILFIAIPWPFSTLSGRPLIRHF